MKTATLAKVWKKRQAALAKCRKLWDEGNKLYQEAKKIGDKGTEVNAKGRKLYADAVILEFGPKAVIDWETGEVTL